jgi:class 3 adenylate cyclase/predicted ATPase
LERLLADHLTAGEENALEAHVAACSACQRRLEQLTCGVLTLPTCAPSTGQSRADSPSPVGVLERAANIRPAEVWLLAQQHAPGGGSEEAAPARPVPSSSEAPDPFARLAAADPAGRPRTPKPEAQRATPQPPDTLDRVGEPGRHGLAGEPPLAFGRYEVRRSLGSGGFGTVYLAHDRELDRPVAVKVFRGRLAVPPAESESLLQEARRLAQLRHPAIVTVYDVGVQEGQVYVVADFLDGPNLGEWLKDNRPSWQDAASIAAAVADALAHAHARLTIHRDVKPDNILLTAGRRPVLVDFGLALDESRAGGREKGVVSGTPWYMSPEQVAGVAHRIDGRTDIYSLGVVLYEMLCGRVPFRSNDLRELLRQVNDDEPQPPRQLVPDLPPELEHVCLKALAKRPQDRYTTAADLAEDLRRVAQAAAGPTTLPPAPPPTGAPAGERRSTPETPPSQRRARDAERRQVTVLVCGCELFDSEEYVGSIDAEDQARVLRAFQQRCEQVARRFDGTVVQCNEEGLLACFGYPMAYEDAAHRAARTGLALLDDLKALGEQLGGEHQMELGPWVGIHTGPAVVETGANAISLVGEARNVAVRLKDGAECGQVVCTKATHRLIRGQFECAGLGNRKVKGVPQPVELFAVRATAAVANPLEARGAELTPLTGRDHEVSLLLDRWGQAREGMGQVVLLVGEPGLGKSRLVYTLKQHLQGESAQAGHPASFGAWAARDATIIEWRCSPHYQNTLLYPARDYLERFLGLGGAEAPAARFGRLVRHLAEYDLARPEVVPLFAVLLSLPTDERFPPLGLSPVREREETFRTLREWLRAYAERRPVLFVVEDLHWVDASTLEFLKRFLAEGLHDRVLTVLTFRTEFQTPWPAVAHQTSLALTRLTRRQVGEMMRRKLGVETLPEAFVDAVHDLTGGVPLFVEEFTKVVQELSLLDRMGDDGIRARALLTREVPASLQDLVMARLDRLAGDRDVALLAAVLGREFSYDLLAAVAALDEVELQAELAKLVQGEILYQKGRPPRCHYVFKHALLQDAAYNVLVKGKRQQFHRRIAEVLEARFPETVQMQPELIAHHCTEAGLTDKAVGYWLQAGLRSQQRSANVEAIGHLTKGLALLATLPESPGRDTQELKLLDPLRSAYQAHRSYGASEIEPIFHRARELCERIGQSSQLFAMLWGTWAWHINRGNIRLCMELAGEAMELAERVNDPGIQMEALYVLGMTRLYRGDFAGARDASGKAVAEYDDRERTRFWATHTGQDCGVAQRHNLALASWQVGYPDQALKLGREAHELARAIGHPFTLAYAAWCAACLCQLCRLGDELLAAADELLRIATDQGFGSLQASGTFYQGAGLLLQGRLAEGLPLLRKGLDAFRAPGAVIPVTYFLSILGTAQIQAGQFEGARQALDDGLALAEKHNDRHQSAELNRLKGELLLAGSGNQAGAEGCFRQAIETARRQQSRAWELRATMSLARLWKQQGRREDARNALAAVYSTYTEGFTTPDLADTLMLLTALN